MVFITEEQRKYLEGKLGKQMPRCVNFRNQAAIDAALQKANECLMEQDRLCGVENPEPLYVLGTNACRQCDYGLGIETSLGIWYMKMMAGEPIKRVCYKEA